MENTVTQQGTILGHPKGLFVLFFTEMWERFSFYGMRAILVLYLTAQSTGDNPGLEWTSTEALALYGWYGMFVYFMGIFGGLAADKWLGQKKAVLVGGIFIILGQFSISIDSIEAFYTGLILLVCGVGLLKPNISTMVGGLYARGDSKRDAGFTIFYIGINIGALAAPLLVGYVGEVYDWHLGFSLAGFGMILGQLVYVFGRNYLKGVGDLLLKSETQSAPHKTRAAIERSSLEFPSQRSNDPRYRVHRGSLVRQPVRRLPKTRLQSRMTGAARSRDLSLPWSTAASPGAIAFPISAINRLPL